jgi:ribose-phosphate pyrophosphokinase
LDEIVLLSGTTCVPLMNRMARQLDIEPGDFLIGRFSDGEVRVQIKKNIRGRDVYVIQSTGAPAENLLELLLLIDAAKRASAARITAVIPYFGYARQDRKAEPRVPISAKLIANFIEKAGADRVLTVDLHADQIQGFFDVPVDNLYATPVFKPYIDRLISEGQWMVVAPDVGSSKRAYRFAEILGNLPIALIDKRRVRPNDIESVRVIGDVEGMNCLMVDDIIDTGGSLRRASDALKELGARRIFAAATHGVFSGNAKETLSNSAIEGILVTNTIPPNEENLPSKTRVLDISPLLAEAVRRIHENRSVSELFVGKESWKTLGLWQNQEKI